MPPFFYLPLNVRLVVCYVRCGRWSTEYIDIPLYRVPILPIRTLNFSAQPARGRYFYPTLIFMSGYLQKHPEFAGDFLKININFQYRIRPPSQIHWARTIPRHFTHKYPPDSFQNRMCKMLNLLTRNQCAANFTRSQQSSDSEPSLITTDYG